MFFIEIKHGKFEIMRVQCRICGNLQHRLHAVKRLLRICRIQIEPTRFSAKLSKTPAYNLADCVIIPDDIVVYLQMEKKARGLVFFSFFFFSSDLPCALHVTNFVEHLGTANFQSFYLVIIMRSARVSATLFIESSRN